MVEISRKWYQHAYCQSVENKSFWPCEKIQHKTALGALELDSDQHSDSGNLEDALVSVSFSSPYSVQGRSGNQSSYGTGVIVDIEKGWIVVAQSVVYSMLGDIKITFNNRYEVNGKVEYIHPLHNLALISYEPDELGEASVSQALFVDKLSLIHI